MIIDKLEALAALVPPADRWGKEAHGYTLNPLDVAGALGYAKVSEGASLYARAKYACQNSQRSKLSYWTLTKRVIPAAIKHNWGINAYKLALMTKVAMEESINERTRCHVCEGHGYVISDLGKAIECGNCESEGFNIFTDSQRYQACNIQKRDWKKYAKAYKTMLEIFSQYDEELSNALTTNLFRGY